MLIDFSICEFPEEHNKLIFDTFFHIQADNTYNTPRKKIAEGKIYFLYTLRGEGQICCNGRNFTATANTFIYMAPREDMSYRCKDDSWEFWWFEFFGPCPCIPNKLYHLAPDPLVFQMLEKALNYTKYGSWDIASSLLFAINQIVVREASLSHKAAQNEQMMASIESYIRENQGGFTVQDLSKVFSMEERTLRNLFYSCTGLSPKQLITKLRMEHAGHLLQSTNHSLEEIAQRLGYSSQYHFGRAFKAFFGVTPARYRKYIH